MIPNEEKTILVYMAKLGLSRAQAIQLLEDEREDNLPELSQEQKEVEKSMRQADRRIETAPRKRTRKPDNNKRELICLFMRFLSNSGFSVNITNPEREIVFQYGGETYRLTLSKPRSKVEGE